MALLIAAVPCLLLGVQAKELSIEMEHSLDGLTFSKAGYLQGSLFDSVSLDLVLHAHIRCCTVLHK